MTSTFKVGTGGQFPSPLFQGISGVFPTIFILYSNVLPSEVLSPTSSALSL